MTVPLAAVLEERAELRDTSIVRLIDFLVMSREMDATIETLERPVTSSLAWATWPRSCSVTRWMLGSTLSSYSRQTAPHREDEVKRACARYLVRDERPIARFRESRLGHLCELCSPRTSHPKLARS